MGETGKEVKGAIYALSLAMGSAIGAAIPTSDLRGLYTGSGLRLCESKHMEGAGVCGTRTPHPDAGAARGVEGRKILAFVTRYCATGPGCKARICGGNLRTAHGTDATKEGGFAADPRWCPYGTRIRIDGRTFVHDDNFGPGQRARDRALARPHIDIRVAGRTHDEVRRMGAGWVEIEILGEDTP